MKKNQLIIFVLALMMIGFTALGMHRLKTHQKLGAPGLKTTPIAGSPRLNVYLPEWVAQYDSVLVPTDTNVLNGLPHDTSFMQRRYTSSETNVPMYNGSFLMNVVLMGTDRTSIHKPQFCLTGSGWNIDGGDSALDTIHIGGAHPYDLPVMKLFTTREAKLSDDKVHRLRGLYVYWFVADNELTAQHEIRMWKTATHLLHTGELQRWAYVSCFAVCPPGNEAATYDLMKKFIASSVPQFQLIGNDLHVASEQAPQTASR